VPLKLVPPPTEGEETDPVLIDLLTLVTKNNPKADLALVTKAYRFTEEAHKDQKRHSGEPYLIHPVGVATILADYQLDTATIATGLLHDTVEDTRATLEQIHEKFGVEIAALVDGVTKLSKMTFKTSEEKQAENFRKMILAMAKDLRVILVKLADRLHNMRTLQHMRPEKQAAIAQETLEIYGPLANRLGLSSMKRELEDLSLRYTKPEIYFKLVALVEKRLTERQDYVRDVQAMVQSALQSHGYTSAEVTGRPKHFYSIHQKMEKRNLSYEQVYDITGFRIIVDSVEHCYGCLGMIHSLWTPVPGRFKDYIAIPKANFYQSLHTTVVGPKGEKVEFQIRTRQMHDTAERGIAAHWAYKEGSTNNRDMERFKWLSRLVEANQDLGDPNEFLESVKLDLFSEEVYVFTPKGQVMEFPQGATPLDFAYTIHTDLGNRCIGAKVNNRMVPLKYKMKSGDTLEILTSPNQTPNKDWLKIVKTGRAKNKIRNFIKQVEHERSLATGEMILDKELKRLNFKLKTLINDGTLLKVAESFSFRTVQDLMSAVGYGKISPAKIVTRLSPKEKDKDKKEEKPEEEKKPGMLQRFFQAAQQTQNSERHVVKVKGVEDILVRFARCCNPVPGDPVTGFITRGRGISVHSRNCPKIFDSDPHRLVEIEWDLSSQAQRSARIRILCEDRAGLLADMSQVIKEQKVNITRAQIGTTRDKKAVCNFTISISSLLQLKQVISTLEGVPGVIMVERVQKKSS
jgi:GTP diphosphokinase / guanosine-3',5'-bis(diphosphate) 3'-diphosphatase